MCKEYGADVAINYKTQDFAVEVLSATGDRGEIISYSTRQSLVNVTVTVSLDLQGPTLFLILLVPPTGRNTANVLPQMEELCIWDL